MLIREIKIEDREEVFRMMRVFYDSEAVMHTAPDVILYQDIDDCLSDLPFIEGFIFEEEGVLMGYSMVAPSYSTEYGGICIWIEDIYIKPEFRGRGIAKHFFAFLEKRFEGKAVRYKLEVELENESAISVYERVGYHKLQYFVMSKEVENEG